MHTPRVSAARIQSYLGNLFNWSKKCKRAESAARLEPLDRRLMLDSTYTAGTSVSTVTLKHHPSSTYDVDVFEGTSSTPATSLTPDSTDNSISVTGHHSGFKLIDQVSAAAKPTGGVQFHVVGYSNGELDIDATTNDDDQSMTVTSSTSTSTTIVTYDRTHNKSGTDTFGAGVQFLTLETSDATATEHYHDNGNTGSGSLGAGLEFSPSKSLRVEAQGPYAEIDFGSTAAGETVTDGVIYAPAGHALVYLNTDADDPTTAYVDFGTSSGNVSTVYADATLFLQQTGGTSHIIAGGTVTLLGGTLQVDEQATITDIEVYDFRDQTNVYHPGAIINDAAWTTIGTLHVHSSNDPVNALNTAVIEAPCSVTTLTVDSASLVDVTAGSDITTFTVNGTATIEDTSSIGDLEVYGVVTFTSTSDGSSIPIFDVNGGGAVILIAPVTIGSFVVSGSGALALLKVSQESAGDLTVSSGGIVTIQQRSSSPSVSSPRVLVVTSLDLGGTTATGKLDIKNNDLIIEYSSSSPIGSWNGTNYTGVTGLIQSGRGSGVWDGNGIISTWNTTSLYSIGIAEASQRLGGSGGVFGGHTTDATAVLVKFTYGGDANIDGKINIDDYTRIDSGIAISANMWWNGDFNYDGKINIDDYTIIDGNIGNQGSGLGS